MGWRDYMSACTFVCHVMLLDIFFRASFVFFNGQLLELL